MKKIALTERDRRALRIELARISFWDFCRLMAPDFYLKKKKYLRYICEKLQQIYESPQSRTIINLPPRFGKSRTASLFTLWVFGQSAAHQVMIGSYNETLSQTFSKSVRDSILTEQFDSSKIVYRDIFPEVMIQYGDGAVNKWTLEGQYSSYLATSPTGTATGFGADIMIIDDLIKNAEEANNVAVLEKHWQWYTDTMVSRQEKGCKLFVFMTRWHSNDLAGRLMQHWESMGLPYTLITMRAQAEDGTMLDEDILDAATYAEKISSMGEDIASANYNQIPIDIKGKLYSALLTYDKVPTDNAGYPLFEGVYAYVDTADEGDDYLCAIVFGEYAHEAYILDVLYTKAGMEVTERQVAEMLTEWSVGTCIIESNNGGRGFARSVERILSDELRNYITVIKWFHQSKNKRSRILTSASWIMKHLYFPQNWRHRWPEFHAAMTTYQREGKNAHDDAPDTATGVAEVCSKLKIGVVNI